VLGIIAASSTYSKLTDLPRIPEAEVAAVNTLDPFSSSMSPLFQDLIPFYNQIGKPSYMV
jgi:hypothetical protein